MYRGKVLFYRDIDRFSNSGTRGGALSIRSGRSNTKRPRLPSSAFVPFFVVTRTIHSEQTQPASSPARFYSSQGACDTEFMQSPLQSPTAATDPKSVKVNITTGTGVEIEWRDGHASHYSFTYLRDACPCAMCEEERGKSGRRPGDAPKLAPGALPMFKPIAKPVSAEPVGKYAIRFSWNDNHDLGIYSWRFLREICPCQECKVERGG
jgi:DUF971 family protein